MSSEAASLPQPSVGERVTAVDWEGAQAALDERGHALLPGLLRPAECGKLAALYVEDGRFRATISLERHRFGRGEYRYFAAPLPEPVAALRRALYPPLARIANRWQSRLGARERYPRSLAAFLRRCREAGQQRPTPLLLRYGPEGFNCLHQDLYGAVAFPLQVALLLSDPLEFEGGEFLLVEQRPRQQSRGEAIALRQGEAVVFPTRERPVEGSRGPYRATLRHGVSRLRKGSRTTLGIIFHDAT